MTAKRRQRPALQTPEVPDLLGEYGRRLVAVSDPLEAEGLAAAMLAVPTTWYAGEGGAGPELANVLTTTLIDLAAEQPSAESAALLRAIVAVAPPSQRRQAVAGLGVVTAAGHYPPEWAATIGRAIPREAWRRYDVFDDTETIAVTFAYGEAEHAVLVQVDRCREPTVLAVSVTADVVRLRSVLDHDDDPLTRVEPVGLAEARTRLAEALSREPDPDDGAGLSDAARVSLPIARARVRRLPVEDRPAPPRYGEPDRTAAVAEFLAGPQAGEAGDEKTARFWAEVLTGYSACVPGDPPARVGPLKLTHLLLSYVPATFSLTEELRRALPAAVTAWTRWAADRQGLDEPARTALAGRLPQVLAGFEETYHAPEVALVRGYLADVSATTTDAAVLAEALTRRALAVPLPEERAGDHTRLLDATDPAHRRSVVEQEYGECEPPDGLSRTEFLAAAVEVCEQLWHDAPPARWQRARELIDAGIDPHDVIHELVARPAG